MTVYNIEKFNTELLLISFIVSLYKLLLLTKGRVNFSFVNSYFVEFYFSNLLHFNNLSFEKTIVNLILSKYN